MTIRTRILDMLPALIVFAIVAAFATVVLVVYVAREPLIVPPPQRLPASDLPHHTATTPSRTDHPRTT